MKHLIAISFLVVVVVIIVVLYHQRCKDFSSFIEGVWTGSQDFMASAGLQSFELFIAPPDRGQAVRRGYISMVAAGDGEQESGHIADHPIKLRLGRIRPTGAAELRLSIEGSDAPSPGVLFPQKMTATADRNSGTLTFRSGGKVYAVLLKEGAATEAAIKEWKA